jgi:galactitol-specific phosphotransferase system IIB component
MEFQTSASSNNYKINVESIDIKKVDSTDGAYDFIVNVVYNKEDVEEKIAQVSGRAYLYEEGKINYLKYLDDGGLSNALKQ